MSPRSLTVVALAVFLAACGGDGKNADEPKTARDKLRADKKDKKDRKDSEDEPSTRPWGKWRYSGDRTSCFFRVGRKCFKTQAAACSAARCAKGKCETEGAGPVAVSCKK